MQARRAARPPGGRAASVPRPPATAPPDAGRRALVEAVAGAAIALFGLWFLWQAAELREGPGYAAVGPKVFPLIVGAGLFASGALLILAQVVRAQRPEPLEEAEATPPTDWRTLGALALLLALYVLAFRPLGFILSTVAFLPAGARVLGSRSPVRDLAVGVALALATDLTFTRLLGLELPAGPLAGLVPGIT